LVKSHHMATIIVITSAIVSAIIMLWLGHDLPDLVASHFGTSGHANAYMPRTAFIAIMLFVTSVLPLLIWLLQVFAVRRGRLRIPNSDYWLAPANRAQTVAFLERHGAVLSVATTVFMTFVFVLVVKASHAQPPRLPLWPFVTALFAFMVFVLVWALLPFLRFRRRDNT